jgi:hypothetical protein
MFEMIAGLKINFSKSEILMINDEENWVGYLLWAISKHKKKGGVGIKDLTKLNISLLCKWWWKVEHKEGLWQKLVKAKYLSKSSIYTVSHKLHDSPMWYDLLKVKDVYLKGRIVKIENGKNTRLWEDCWVFDKPLSPSS